jgi:hypothetical protein
MGRRDRRNRPSANSRSQWLIDRSISHRELTETVIALELDTQRLPTTDEVTPDFPNEEDASSQEINGEVSTPHPFLSDNSDDESDSEEQVPPDYSTTVAEQVDIFHGHTATEVSAESNHIPPEDDTVILSPLDLATLDVLKLCHNAGCSLEFYDLLFALLRKHSSKNKVDVTKLPKRDTFLKNLRTRISSPPPIISQVGNLQVPHFDILSQLRDLLGSFVFNDLNNLCVNMDPEERFNVFVASEDDKFVEVCAQRWYRDTHAEFIKDPKKQFLLPLIFYIDETGTDVFQRYPLEPLMFTLGILRNFVRERSSSWRHAGFIPKVPRAKTSCESLQLYHDCMAMVLSTLKTIQDHPPTESLQFGDDPPVEMELIIQVCFMMGDQKSQDNLTGRKLNNTGFAGRSHRGCMCSGPYSSDPCLWCKPVPIQVLNQLRDISFTSNFDSPLMKGILNKYPLSPRGKLKREAKLAQDFVRRRAGLAREILGEVFTMHPIHNAWNDISFGANKNGIFAATLDDPMHFNESGLFDGVTKAFYGCFTEEELKKFEESTRSLYQHSRSSVRSEFPKSRISKGFTNCTLKTANETVGSLLSVVLTVQDNKVFDLMEQVGKRQKDRYITFPVTVASNVVNIEHQNKNSKKPSTKRKRVDRISKLVAKDKVLLGHYPSRRNYTFGRYRTHDPRKDFPRTTKSCCFLFEHLKKHGLGFILDLELDDIQMEYLLVVSWKILSNIISSEEFYPVDSLQNILQVFPYPQSRNKKRIEKYYETHLHRKNTLRSTSRGETVKLSAEDISNHTTYEDGRGESDEMDDTGDEKPTKKQKASQTRKMKTQTIETVTTRSATTTISFPALRRMTGCVVKHGRMKPYTKGTGSTCAFLCGVIEYIRFIELALCLHAYLHYSKDILFEKRCQPEIFDRGVREFLRLFNAYVFRGDDSIDTDTCKIHCHLHILENILNYGDPMQYDAAKGERGLKDWAKHISQTAQKCGIDIFLFQTIHRVSTYQLLQRAEQLELWRKRKLEKKIEDSGVQEVQEPIPVRPVMNRKLPHFRYKTGTKVLYAVDRKGVETLTTKKTGAVDKRILDKIEREHPGLEDIDIWGEIYLTNASGGLGQLLRGHPTFDRYGEMFDWAAVTFDTADSNEGLVGPAKLLAFYKDVEGVPHTVVHATNVTTNRETSVGNSMLIQNVRLEFDIRGHPALRTIRVDQIDRGIMAFEHVNFEGPLPGTINYTADRGKYVVSCFVDRSDWAYLFFDWANKLTENKEAVTSPGEGESDSQDNVSDTEDS